jgi:hypothetical protein
LYNIKCLPKGYFLKFSLISYEQNRRKIFCKVEKNEIILPGVTDEFDIIIAPSDDVKSFNLLSLLALRNAIRGLFDPGILIVVR